MPKGIYDRSKIKSRKAKVKKARQPNRHEAMLSGLNHRVDSLEDTVRELNAQFGALLSKVSTSITAEQLVKIIDRLS